MFNNDFVLFSGMRSIFLNENICYNDKMIWATDDNWTIWASNHNSTKWSPLMISTYVHVMLVDVKMIFYYDVVILHLSDEMCFVRLILWNKLFSPEMKIDSFNKSNFKRMICFLIKNSIFDQSYPNLCYTVQHLLRKNLVTLKGVLLSSKWSFNSLNLTWKWNKLLNFHIIHILDNPF